MLIIIMQNSFMGPIHFLLVNVQGFVPVILQYLLHSCIADKPGYNASVNMYPFCATDKFVWIK